MPALFSELRKQLLHYRKANVEKRVLLIKAAIAAIDSIKGVEKDDFYKACKTLTLSAALIQYADTLNKMESMQSFRIPEVFATLELEPEFGPEAQKATDTVKEYFEISKAPYTQMKLLKPITAIPKQMWKALREKQNKLLTKENIHNQYILDELDIDNPPSDALYPLRVQFQPRLRHREFDCIGPNQNGSFQFYSYPTEHCLLLPCGKHNPTFCSSDFSRTEKTSFIHNYLDEHLALYHNELYSTAAKEYNKINPDVFTRSLNAVITRFKDLVNTENLNEMNKILKEKKENSARLHSLIKYLHTIKVPQPKQIQIETLKACLQVETFRLTNIYESAIKYLKKSPVKSIEQFGDTTQGGGYQFSDVIFLPKSLAYWLHDKHKLTPKPSKLAEAVNTKPTQILDLLEDIEQINFSTLLTVLQSTKKVKETSEMNVLLPIISRVKKILLDKAKLVIQNENQSHEALSRRYEDNITILRCFLDTCKKHQSPSKNYKSLIKHTNELIDHLKASEDKIQPETLAVIAESTVRLFNQLISPNQYQELAKNFTHGEKRPVLIKLGVAMAAIALALGALAAFGVLPLIAAGVGAGSVFLLSCGLFAKARESGLRKDMSNLTKDSVKILPQSSA